MVPFSQQSTIGQNKAGYIILMGHEGGWIFDLYFERSFKAKYSTEDGSSCNFSTKMPSQGFKSSVRFLQFIFTVSISVILLAINTVIMLVMSHSIEINVNFGKNFVRLYLSLSD